MIKINLIKRIFLENESDLSRLINDMGALVHPLAMPFWVYTPEFDTQSRSYFQIKKR